MSDHYILLDKIKWWIKNDINGSKATPLCPKHNLILFTYLDMDSSLDLTCEECKSSYHLPRTFGREKAYVISKVASTFFGKQKFINLDDIALPIAEEKIETDSPYFVTSLLTKSKVGLRLIVYAGIKGSKDKTQIFVEPEIKRLAFDQTNLHPNDVFTKVEATFIDGSKHKLTK